MNPPPRDYRTVEIELIRGRKVFGYYATQREQWFEIKHKDIIGDPIPQNEVITWRDKPRTINSR